MTGTLGRTNAWLFIIIFFICAKENEQIVIDPNITVFKIVFEVVSAFGCVGLSLGYPGISSSFTTVLSPVSRVVIGLTMLLGRHRGLLASLKDQEKVEHKANELLHRWKEKVIHQYVTEEAAITTF
jgi:Trk-type K+ transport system membrane component